MKSDPIFVFFFCDIIPTDLNSGTASQVNNSIVMVEPLLRWIGHSGFAGKWCSPWSLPIWKHPDVLLFPLLELHKSTAAKYSCCYFSLNGSTSKNIGHFFFMSPKKQKYNGTIFFNDFCKRLREQKKGTHAQKSCRREAARLQNTSANFTVLWWKKKNNNSCSKLFFDCSSLKQHEFAGLHY